MNTSFSLSLKKLNGQVTMRMQFPETKSEFCEFFEKDEFESAYREVARLKDAMSNNVNMVTPIEDPSCLHFEFVQRTEFTSGTLVILMIGKASYASTTLANSSELYEQVDNMCKEFFELVEACDLQSSEEISDLSRSQIGDIEMSVK